MPVENMFSVTGLVKNSHLSAIAPRRLRPITNFSYEAGSAFEAYH